jgi:hypothetical protein
MNRQLDALQLGTKQPDESDPTETVESERGTDIRDVAGEASDCVVFRHNDNARKIGAIVCGWLPKIGL